MPDAAGYVIERTDGPNGLPRILDHGGSDVPAIPSTAFADTGLVDGVEYHYRIGAVFGAEYPVWNWSPRVSAHTVEGDPGDIDVGIDVASVVGTLDRVWHLIGSERLSQLTLPLDEYHIAAEFAGSLRQAHDDLGVSAVRAHAIFHDDNEVVHREPSGALSYNFDRVDAIYDLLLEIGIRPVVELSYMPAALARDPARTVFTYRAIVSPPADWTEWHELVATFVSHLVERYGVDEVIQWAFEVWNEPNLEVFWAGTRSEYLRLYEESARAVKSVDSRLLVGGPSTAADEWIQTLAEYAEAHDVPLDFASTHTYGNLPLDLRPALRRNGFEDIPIWWTEWGVGSTHFGPIHDGVIGAPFVLSGLAAAQGRVDALAYWVVSDHFEELGRPPRLFHNGFGLLTVGNLRKPRYWAVHLAAHLGDQVLASHVTGDGADILVQAWATQHDDGTVDVLVWNGVINAALMNGDRRLDRHVRLTMTGLDAGTYEARLARVDAEHSNVITHCPADVEWPDEALWTRLRARDALDEEELPTISAEGGTARLDFALPMPGVARIRLSRGHPAAN